MRTVEDLELERRAERFRQKNIPEKSKANG